jgi:hypothetical protein
VSGQLHAPAAFTPGTHCIGGWVDLRAGVDDVKKRKFLTLLGLVLRPVSRPARSHSLYGLRYPDSCRQAVHKLITSLPSGKLIHC